MKYNDLINELLDIIDKNEDIKIIKELKEKLLVNSTFLGELENYKINKTIDNKKKLYNNTDYLNYLRSETNINILIQEIKNKFSIFNDRRCLK